MENLTIGQIFLIVMAVAGLITAVGGATSVLKRWWTNSKSMKNEEKINKLDKRVENVEEKTNELENHQKQNEEFTKIMCNSMLALLNHSITGNNIIKLKEAEEEIKQYLINK